MRPTNPFIEFKREAIEQSIPARFEAIVRKYPQRLALKTKTLQLTYRELNQAANRVAHAIVAQCGNDQSPVILLFKDRVKGIIAILGALKAHKIYVSVEPSNPAARIAQIVEDAGVALIVTDNANSALAANVPSNVLPVINLDRLDENLSTENLNLSIAPDSISNILYTSGSTGQPKGVYLNHRNALEAVLVETNDLHLSAEDRNVLLAATSFGASAATIFPALLNGSTLLPYDVEEDGLGNLADWLSSEEITIYQSVPSVFREWVATLKGDEKFPKLRLIRVAGDRVHKQDLELYKKHFSDDCLFRVGFGSTEAGGGIAAYLIGKQTPITSKVVPVGYALEDRQVSLIDETGRELGIDSIGEIVVKSRYLPLGYWRHPELTAQVYSSDPLDPSLRICRTGDLGRLGRDGLLEHVGRKDFQVKLRGHRVEPEAIENILHAHPKIRECVVVARPNQLGESRLVAYIAPRGSPTPTSSELRDHVARSLPAHMIPARFVFLEKLPRNANGKIDRKALPAPNRARPALSTPFAAPQSELESQIAKVWCEWLELDQVGIHENFFDLGGDSLSAMTMILEVEKFAKQTIPLEYFQNPTIAALAQFCKPTVILNGAKNLRRSDGDSSSQRALLRMTTRDERDKAKSFQHRLVRLAAGKISSNTILRWAIQNQVQRLSYEQGLHWLAWIGQPKIASRLFREERQMLRRLSVELGNPSAATNDAFRASVLGNMIWQGYRQTALNTPWLPGGAIAVLHTAPDLFWRSFAKRVDGANYEERGRLFEFSGLEYLYDAQKQKRGAILVTYHSPAILITNAILTRYTNLGHIPTLSEETAEQMAEREQNDDDNFGHRRFAWSARFALEGQRILKQGGVIQIVNDMSYAEENSLRKTIGARSYDLKTGFAKLALSSGATMLPVYHTFDVTGRVRMSILPAFEPLAKKGDHLACVHHLLDQYVAFLEDCWRTRPESVGWGAMRRYFSRPPAE